MHLLNLANEYSCTVHFLLIDKECFPSELPITAAWSIEAYYRLLLLDLLPMDVDRLLYLDVDMIIDKSIMDLYSIDFEYCLFCVWRDMTVSFPTNDIRDDIFREEIQQGIVYFNSGLMLWNVEKLRNKYSLNDYMELAKKLDYRMLAPDQDLLNKMHWKQVMYVDEYQYNLFARMAFVVGIRYKEVKEETTVIHFAGDKPWNTKSFHYDIEKIWWEYAKRTPFYVELMEEFLDSSLSESLIYDTMKELSDENEQLKCELDKNVAACKNCYNL